MKYLICWKVFIAKSDTWKKKKKRRLRECKKVVAEFEKRLSTEVRRQEKLDLVEERDFRKRELLEKYIAKKLYR